MITAEDCRKLEESLTEEQRDASVRRMEHLGWAYNSAPTWVWYQVFSEAIGLSVSPPSTQPPWLENLEAYQNWSLTNSF